MAIGATIFKVDLDVADMDRGYYAAHALTLARHPSETDERMMVRVLAFALHAHERLEIGRGIGSTDEEPDLVQRDLTGRMERWIDVGLPDERRVRRACGQAGEVVVCTYGGRTAAQWWDKARAELARCRNLRVIAFASATTEALAALVAPRMSAQFLVQEGDAWLALGDQRIEIGREVWMEPGTGR